MNAALAFIAYFAHTHRYRAALLEIEKRYLGEGTTFEEALGFEWSCESAEKEKALERETQYFENKLNVFQLSLLCALSLILLYCLVNLFYHKDINFFDKSISATMSIFGISTDAWAFFTFYPIILIGLYAAVFFSVGQKLKENLTPQYKNLKNRNLSIFDIIRSVCCQVVLRNNNSKKIETSTEMIIAILIISLWAVGVMVFFCFWYFSLATHDEVLMLVNATTSSMAVCIAIWCVLPFCSSHKNGDKTRSNLRNYATLGVGAAIWLTTVAVSWDMTKSGYVLSVYPADLKGAELTRRPKEWKSFPHWLVTDRYPDWKPANEQERLPRIAPEDLSTWAHRTDLQEGPKLEGANLNNALLQNAFFPRADLRNAKCPSEDFMNRRNRLADFGLRGLNRL